MRGSGDHFQFHEMIAFYSINEARVILPMAKRRRGYEMLGAASVFPRRADLLTLAEAIRNVLSSKSHDMLCVLRQITVEHCFSGGRRCGTRQAG
jgi:hypothetical protein